jgi:hypothetical protein
MAFNASLNDARRVAFNATLNDARRVVFNDFFK